MNSLPTSRCVRPGKAFTLVEMLTAVAVLSLLVVILAQITGVVSNAWINGQRNVNNFTKARAMLNVFSNDIQFGLFRSDLCAFPSDGSGGSEIKFYSQRPGISSGGSSLREVSLVQYAYSTDQSTAAAMSTLQRGDLYFTWSNTPNALTLGNTTDFGSNNPTARDTAIGVVDYKVTFIYADGSIASTYTASTANPLRAVGLTLAVVDDRTLKLLTTSQVRSLRQVLDGEVSSSTLTSMRSVKAIWENYLDTKLDWKTYPVGFGAGLKIFELYVNLNTY